MSAASVGIVITTRDRKELLRQTLRETARQTYRPLDILVIDDGSTDGTEAMVRSEFPNVQFVRNETSQGYIHSRNRAADLLEGCRYLVSLDDDSWFLNDDGIARLVELFSRHADAALLSCEIFMPYHLPLAPDLERDGAEIASFAGCGYAVDRERFISVGRFCDFFEFYSEENDFILRVMGQGLTCRFAASAPVYHLETPSGRRGGRIIRYSTANALATILMREPLWLAIPRAKLWITRLALHYARTGKFGDFWAGLKLTISRAGKIAAKRSPVSWKTLRKYRRLQREWRDYFLARRNSTASRRDDLPLR